MGRDKAQLEWRGQPLIAHQLATLRATGAAEIWISARDPAKYAWTGVPTIVDEAHGVGPIGGIAAALAHCRTPLLLVLGIDLPHMTTAFLRQLIAHARPSGGIIYHREIHLEPLAAAYPREALAAATRALETTDHSLQRWARELIDTRLLTAVPLDATDFPLFANLNTPEAFHADVGRFLSAPNPSLTIER